MFHPVFILGAMIIGIFCSLVEMSTWQMLIVALTYGAVYMVLAIKFGWVEHDD